MNKNRGERGQALVLIIVSAVALFGFAALAVDTGRVYMERRRAQSAADSAAYAAAFAAARGQDWRNVALSQLKDNGYDDTDPGVNDDQQVDVQLFNPPTDASTANYDDPTQYYQVIIRAGVPPIFSQFVYQGQIAFTVEAVSHTKPISSIFPNGAFVATAPKECQALKFHGTQDLKIVGGSIISNSHCTGGETNPTESCTDGGDSNACTSLTQEGSGGVEIDGGGIYTGGSIKLGSSPTSDEGINPDMGSSEIPLIPPPDCSGLPELSYTGQATLDPGIYKDGIRVTGSKTVLKLNPGMYCLDDSFTMNGGKITGTEVLIVMRDGDFDIGGGTIARLSQNPTLEDPSGQKWGGMLLYMPYDNDGYVAMSGNTGTHYTGTLYAPGPRTPSSQTKCKIEGTTSAIALNSAVICYTIDVGGTAGVTVYYHEQQNYRLPPALDLNK